MHKQCNRCSNKNPLDAIAIEKAVLLHKIIEVLCLRIIRVMGLYNGFIQGLIGSILRRKDLFQTGPESLHGQSHNVGQ